MTPPHPLFFSFPSSSPSSPSSSSSPSSPSSPSNLLFPPHPPWSSPPPSPLLPISHSISHLPWRVLGWTTCSAVVTRWQRTIWPMLPRERDSFRGKHTTSFCNRTKIDYMMAFSQDMTEKKVQAIIVFKQVTCRLYLGH